MAAQSIKLPPAIPHSTSGALAATIALIGQIESNLPPQMARRRAAVIEAFSDHQARMLTSEARHPGELHRAAALSIIAAGMHAQLFDKPEESPDA